MSKLKISTKSVKERHYTSFKFFPAVLTFTFSVFSFMDRVFSCRKPNVNIR